MTAKIIKYLVILFIFLPVVVISSCSKENITDTIDITAPTWKLKKIISNGETLKPDKKYFKNNSYFLNFKFDPFLATPSTPIDSVFFLSFSSNAGGGGYSIPEKGKIIISVFGAFTERGGGDRDFDEKLLETFQKVTTYTVIGNSLTFKGSLGKVEFKKQ